MTKLERLVQVQNNLNGYITRTCYGSAVRIPVKTGMIRWAHVYPLENGTLEVHFVELGVVKNMTIAVDCTAVTLLVDTMSKAFKW